MGVTEELNPVESLYILDRASREVMDYHNALAANLAYLESTGHIRQDGSRLGLGATGRPRDGLRPYESDTLEALMKKDHELVFDAVNSFDFSRHLAKKGFLDRTRGRWYKLFLPDYDLNGKSVQALGELEILKKDISPGDPMAYAFPSLGLNSEYLIIAKRITGAVFNSRMRTAEQLMDVYGVRSHGL